MRVARSSFSKFLATILCFAAIAACSPLKTGSLDPGLSEPPAASKPVDKSYTWQPAVKSPLSGGDESGWQPGDVEPEPERTRDQELKELEKLGEWEQGVPTVEYTDEVSRYDFPVTINRQVEYYLDFFTGRHRENFALWLSRSGRYLSMIHQYLNEAGLPEDLAYLAMIESGYNERAYSRARAVGIWQFIKSTGRNYGLTINSYVDERRNPVRSTQAAVSYLSDLYKEFNSWHLAVAAYNAGEGKIRRAIEKYNTTDFWTIAQGDYLKLETKRYVPKLIAAIIIAKDPARYGFDNITYQPPLAYEEVEVPRWTSVKAVALACSMEPDELKQFNNELSKEFTPPDQASYSFRVPVGKKTEVEKNLPRVQAVVTTGFKTHNVKQGETLSSICKKYGLTKTVMLKSNNLRSAGLQAGQRLRIPYQTTSYEMLPEGSISKGYLAAESSDGNFMLHRVLPGETVSELARRYSVPVHLIAAWNDLSDISRIKAGQQLVFYVQDNRHHSADISEGSSSAGRQLAPEHGKVAVSPEEQQPQEFGTQLAEVRAELHSYSDTEDYYVVQNGDSLWGIARKFNLDAGELKQLNNLLNNVIHPGDRLLVAGGARPAAADTYYQVQRGDSLWSIARNHQVTPEEIKRWNNLEDSIIHPGDSVLIRLVDNDSSVEDTYYQVRSGDSLWTIARNYNVSPEEIRRWNNLENNVIHPGNRLLLKLAKGG